MLALEEFDQATRDMAFQDYAQFQHELASALLHSAVEDTVRLLDLPGKTSA